MKLTGKDKHYLRGLGHHLKPILQIGKNGVSEDFITNLERELEHHELLKIKVLESSPVDKKRVANEIEKVSSANIAQIIGKTLLLYRPFKEEPQITLPR
jgi:RNA-binding protein